MDSQGQAAWSIVASWHHTVVEQFVSQMRGKRLPHAILVEGASGIGKKALVRYLANMLLCQNGIELGNPCGDCKQCKLVDSDSHADFRWLEPEESGKQLKVDAVRSLVEFVNQSSQQGGYKLAVLAPADAMNLNAANALLKTLEEPTPNTLIFLVTERPGMLMPTVRSRCQSISLSIPSTDVVTSWLRQTTASENISSEELSQVIELAGFAPFKALDLIESGALSELSLVHQELAEVLKQTIPLTTVAERWSDDRLVIRLHWFLQGLQQAIRRKQQSLPLQGHLDKRTEKMLDYVASKASNSKLFNVYDEILAQLRLLSGQSNPNPTMLVESLLIRWVGLIR